MPIFKLVARMGAYCHGVLINACVSMQLCGNGLTVIYLGPRGSFSAHFCPMFIALFRTRDTVSNRIDQSLPTPAHQHKMHGTNEPIRVIGYVLSRGLANILVVFRVGSLLTIKDRHWRKLAAMHIQKADSAYSLPFVQ